jgi:choline dehydrogenase-like flavoprotein
MKSTQRTLQISTGRAKVILCAGTIGTASIALNSGLHLYKGLDLVGKGLIDHAIYLGRFARRSRFATSKDPINLQCLINICGTIALLTVTVNANFFLAGSSVLPIQQYLDPEGNEVSLEEGRLFKPEASDTIGILLEFGAKLDDNNRVLNIPSASPTIRLRRQETHNDEADQVEMQKMATKIRDKVITEILPYQWRHRKGPIIPPSQEDSSPPPYYSPPQPEDSSLPPLPIPFPPPPTPRALAPRLTLLGSGVFAHEVGTMRMDGADGSCGVVDTNLQVKGFNNLHVCDLSVLPCSPPANPTLTLSALSLRLAQHLST